MTLQEMVREKNMTRYQLSQRSGIPWATLSDIWTGKTRLERCSGGTLVKLSGTLGITVEELIALATRLICNGMSSVVPGGSLETV